LNPGSPALFHELVRRLAHRFFCSGSAP